MKAALKKGVEDGTLIQNKNSYKVSAEGKKAAKAKKPATKAAKPTKKKVSERRLGASQFEGSQRKFSSLFVHRRNTDDHHQKGKAAVKSSQVGF